MAEDNIFLAEDCLGWCLAFLDCEEGHFLEGGLEDCGLPEVIPLPGLKLVDIRKQVDQLLDLVIHKIEGKEQAK